jgi:hypothetical protein
MKEKVKITNLGLYLTMMMILPLWSVDYAISTLPLTS